MALPSSGTISLNQMHIEAGGSSGTQVGLNDADIRGLISKSSGSQMSFNEWYGASSFPTNYSRTVTPGKYVILTNQYEYFVSTYYYNQIFTYLSGGTNVAESSDIGQFTDSAGNIQQPVFIDSTTGFKAEAQLRIYMKGHNVGNNWSLSLSGSTITPGSNFTRASETWTAQTTQNTTVTNSSGTATNVTFYEWRNGVDDSATTFNDASSTTFTFT